MDNTQSSRGDKQLSNEFLQLLLVNNSTSKLEVVQGVAYTIVSLPLEVVASLSKTFLIVNFVKKSPNQQMINLC